MSATITLARQESTGKISYINDVIKEQHTGFFCVGCCKRMIAIKSVARKKDWHFRHSEETMCTGGRDAALHNFAVQILLENTAINISKKLQIDYTEPRKEVTIFGKRSDVTVKYQNEDVHFEVFVTHDLVQEKIDLYKSNKIKCIRIDLSDKTLLTAPPENIINAVLNQTKNKTEIYWEDKKQNETDFYWEQLLFLATAFIGIHYFKKQFSKSKRKYSKKY